MPSGAVHPIYIYGYLNRVRSSRWLELESHHIEAARAILDVDTRGRSERS
jgi:hypothetical protein